MINNSSLNKWNRLRQKELSQQFLNEIITGLNCSPFEATAVLDAVHKVFGQYFETSGAMKPGQMLFQVVSVNSGPQLPLAQCQQVTATLTLDAGEEDLAIKEKQGVITLRRHRLERVCHEAFQQGGLLTVEDLANRLFNCGERTICRDLAYFRRQNILLPLRSTIKDMGRTISHRVQIVKLWLRGKEYTDIARECCHSIPAIRNYVDKFKRVISLYQNDFEVNTIAFLAKILAPLATQYIELFRTVKTIKHRRQELKSFLKKDREANRVGGRHD
jgi:hypothetical protein